MYVHACAGALHACMQSQLHAGAGSSPAPAAPGRTERAHARDGALLPQVEREPKVRQLERQRALVAEQHVLCGRGVCSRSHGCMHARAHTSAYAIGMHHDHGCKPTGFDVAVGDAALVQVLQGQEEGLQAAFGDGVRQTVILNFIRDVSPSATCSGRPPKWRARHLLEQVRCQVPYGAKRRVQTHGQSKVPCSMPPARARACSTSATHVRSLRWPLFACRKAHRSPPPANCSRRRACPIAKCKSWSRATASGACEACGAPPILGWLQLGAAHAPPVPTQCRRRP